LQNESTTVPTDVKRRFIGALLDAGLREIEATSFVSPKWVPQLADAAELWASLPSGPAKFSALVPNMAGLTRALDVGVDRIALFTAASDEFTRRNINMSVAESLDRFREVIGKFRADRPGGWVRGYVSTAFECPYAGRIEPKRVVEVADALFELGVDEVSLGDTIGAAAPREVRSLAEALGGRPTDRIAWHFHDTRGTAVANVSAALDLGFEIFDASAGGLGGCPYAPGAGGNLATEDLVYFLERSGRPSGVDLAKLARASEEVLNRLGRAPTAKSQLAAAAAADRCAI
jgi:hydroxymethylglutaryl-CoA lyase